MEVHGVTHYFRYYYLYLKLKKHLFIVYCTCEHGVCTCARVCTAVEIKDNLSDSVLSFQWAPDPACHAWWCPCLLNHLSGPIICIKRILTMWSYHSPWGRRVTLTDNFMPEIKFSGRVLARMHKALGSIFSNTWMCIRAHTHARTHAAHTQLWILFQSFASYFNRVVASHFIFLNIRFLQNGNNYRAGGYGDYMTYVSARNRYWHKGIGTDLNREARDVSTGLILSTGVTLNAGGNLRYFR